MSSLIDWTTFTWDALATLITGVLAVGGAVYVGRRQVGIAERQAQISEKQTEILARQADVADLSLREAIFDRRIAVYEATRKFIKSVIHEQESPPFEVQEEFVQAVLDAQFLFPPSVHEALEEIWKQLSNLHEHRAMQRSTDREVLQKHALRENEVRKWFFDKLGSLPDDFGEELRLIPSSQRAL